MSGYPPEANVGTRPRLRDVFSLWSPQSVRRIFQNHPMNAPRRGAEYAPADSKGRAFWISEVLMQQPKPADDFTSTRLATITVDKAVLTKLRPAAVKRDYSLERLIHELLDRIAEDQLTTAILDD